MRRSNEYVPAFGKLYAKTPKAVFAAVAFSYAGCMKTLCALLLSLTLIGCGGTVSQPMADPAKKPSKPSPPPPPPPPPSPAPPPTPAPPPAIPPLPTSWTTTDLPPLLGADAAQANAVNASGTIVGYSVTSGVPTATIWQGATPMALWQGIASAVNDHSLVVGYRYGTGFTTVAVQSWTDIPLLSGFDSTLATGVNNLGVVVGIAYNSTDTTEQTAFVWSENTGIMQVPGCQAALAINDSGTISGIGTNFDAVICGGTDFGVAGAVSQTNNNGLSVGYSQNDGFVFPSTDLGAQSVATGVNDYGWVVGQSFTPSGSERLSVKAHLQRLFNPKLSGVSHPFIWSQASGLVPLQGIVTANGINGKQIVGATVTPDGYVHGVLVTGQ